MRRKLFGLYNYHHGFGKADYSDIKESLLNEILSYSQQNCPYYAELYKKKNIPNPSTESLGKIPFLDKKIIRENYSSIQSKSKKWVTNYIMNTGGTTGVPLIFPVSSHHEYTHHEFAFKLFGYKKGDKIVSFDGTVLPKEKTDKNLFWRNINRRSFPYGKVKLSSLYLNNETALIYISKLNDIKPDFIRGYPSAINFLALFMLENNIRFEFELKGAFLTAENILPNQILSIRNSFNCPVALEYGHSEVSVFAYTIDDTYEYYCSPFYGYTEVIGGNGKQVQIGKVGEVVVTGFYNKALPFIRYKTGDLALYNGEKDGITRLKRIEGRTQDYLLNKEGEKVFVVGLIYGGHHYFLNNIKKWQIYQDRLGFIEIKIVKGVEFSLEDEYSIKELFLKKEHIESKIEYVDKIELTSGGKSRLIVQNTSLKF